MPNIGTLLKNEITRLASKAVRQQTSALQTASSSQRRQLSALKKQVQALEKEVAKLRRGAASGAKAAAAAEGTPTRFVAKGLVSLRHRLGLGAKDFGLLLGVSMQTIYNWETKKTVPRPAQVAAIAALRGIGKKEARARLDALSASE